MHHIMVKTIACLVLLGALLTVGLTACGPGEEPPSPNTLTITEIPAQLPNTDSSKKIVAVSLLSYLGANQASSTVVAIGLNDGSGKFDLYNSDGETYKISDPWTGTGDYYIVLATTAFDDTETGAKRGDPPNYTYTNGIKFAEAGEAIKYPFTEKDTIAWSKFDEQPVEE